MTKTILTKVSMNIDGTDDVDWSDVVKEMQILLPKVILSNKTLIYPERIEIVNGNQEL